MFNKVDMVFLVSRRSSLSHVFMGILGIFFLVQTGLSQQEFDGDKDYTINLENTDLQELIRFVADATGSTIRINFVRRRIEYLPSSGRGMTTVKSAIPI